MDDCDKLRVERFWNSVPIEHKVSVLVKYGYMTDNQSELPEITVEQKLEIIQRQGYLRQIKVGG